MKNKNLKASILIVAFTLEALAQKFPMTITAEAKAGKAEIRLSGAIYDWNNSAVEITSKIDDFISQGIEDVDVYLNGPGGDVFQASEIENQIQRFTGVKRGFGGALVASAYTKIALSLDSFEMAENGMYMYHKPKGYFSGNENEVTASLKLLQNLTNQYKTSYSTTTGLTVEEIESNWSSGDVWLTAQEAMEQKFITGVIKKTTITPDTKAMFEAIGSTKVPKVTDFTTPPVPRVPQAPKTVVLSETEITGFVNQLILDKKILANQKEAISKLLKVDAENTLTLFGMKPTPQKLSALIDGAKGNKAGRESWTLDDWRQNDPKALRENPDFYAELVQKHTQQ